MIVEFINKKIINKRVREFLRKFLDIGYTEEEFKDRLNKSREAVTKADKRDSLGYIEVEYKSKSVVTMYWPQGEFEYTDDIVCVSFFGSYTAGRVNHEILHKLGKDVDVVIHGKKYKASDECLYPNKWDIQQECNVVENWKDM